MVSEEAFGSREVRISSHAKMPFVLGKVMPGSIRVAWVDHCQLTRECMTIALSQGGSPIAAMPYASFTDLIAKSTVGDVDLVVLHAHSLAELLPQQIAALRKAGFGQPLILVTDDDAADQMAAIRDSLRLGASGHLSTRSTSIDMAVTSFAFAQEGGTFAPLNLLLSEEQRGRTLPPARGGTARARRAAVASALFPLLLTQQPISEPATPPLATHRRRAKTSTPRKTGPRSSPPTREDQS